MSGCVKVTAHLSGPIALSPEGWPPHLDALCELIRSRKMQSIADSSEGRHPAKPRGVPVDQPGQIPIPLARQWVGDRPVPRVSFGIIAPVPQRTDYYIRQFPAERADLLRPKERTVIRTTSGYTKSFRLPLRIVETPQIVWFARLRDGEDGRPTRLRSILSQVHALGKKVSQGYGRVSRWEVERCEEDWSWFAPHEEGPVLMRALPVEAVPSQILGGRRTYCGVCGPYWQQTLWSEAFEPC